jgi:hypothetical protein
MGQTVLIRRRGKVTQHRELRREHDNSHINLVLVYANIVSAFHGVPECDKRLTCAKECSVIFIYAQIDGEEESYV